MNWTQSFRSSFKELKDLQSFLNTNIDQTNYPIFIPKDFAQRIKNSSENSPLRAQFLPSLNENDNSGLVDPIGDQVHQKPGGIIHRYKSRILYSPTTKCPINCRYCFRKNELFENLDTFKASLDELKQYLYLNHDIEEVILTGGDPLVLSNKKIEKILEVIASHKHIKYIRFHTRTPIIIPQRLDEDFLNLLNKFEDQFETISLVIHVNHKDELSCELQQRLKSFTHFNLLSQSVLLKGVNDSVIELVELYKNLNRFKIKPYYLHHPDKVRGAMHFYLPLKTGREIYGKLREFLPGWLIPHYIIDNEQGYGKNLAYNSESLDYSGSMLDRFNKLNSIQMD